MPTEVSVEIGSVPAQASITVQGGDADAADITIPDAPPPQLVSIDAVPTTSAQVDVQTALIEPVTVNVESSTGGGTAPAPSAFLPVPDEVDDTTSTELFYYGWADVNGGWLVRQSEIATAAKLDATVSNNPTYTDFSSAWANRASLAYI